MTSTTMDMIFTASPSNPKAALIYFKFEHVQVGGGVC